MSENNFTDEEIVDYLDGVMEPRLKELLEMGMTMDEDLKRRVERMKVAMQAVKQWGLKQKVGEIHQEMTRKETIPPSSGQVVTQTNKGTRRIIRYTMAVAAVIALFFVIRSFNTGTTTDDLYNQAFVDYHVTSVRGNDTLTKPERLYEEGKYQEVIWWETEQKGMDPQGRLLTGLSYLKTNRPKDAIEWLNNVSATGPYHQDAEYYLALAYLKIGNIKAAVSLMQKIRDTPGHIYRERFTEDYIKKVEKQDQKQD